MHAIIVKEPGGPDQLAWAEVETPKPGPGEVLVRTAAVGVNRADLLQRQGHYPPPQGVTDILGLEASGTVEQVGLDVDQWNEGDEVVALLAGGGYGEYFVVPAGQLALPPTDISLTDSAAVMEVAATVVSNLDRVRLSAGETFLVHGGAGGIGNFAIPYAKHLGCTVATTAGSPEKLAHCTSLGADIVLDYHDDWASALKQATDGRGVDVILDIMGAKYLEPNVDALAEDGRLVVIGLQGGRKGTLNIQTLLNKRATVTATSLRYRPDAQKARIVERVEDAIWPLLGNELALPPISRFGIRDAQKAHEQLESGTNIGKIILEF